MAEQRGLVIRSLVASPFLLRSMENATFMEMTGMIIFGFTTLFLIVGYSTFHTSYHYYHDVVAGYRDGKEGHGS